MTKIKKKFVQEFKEEAVKLVIVVAGKKIAVDPSFLKIFWDQRPSHSQQKDSRPDREFLRIH